MIGASIGGGASLVASWESFKGFPNNTIGCNISSIHKPKMY